MVFGSGPGTDPFSNISDSAAWILRSDTVDPSTNPSDSSRLALLQEFVLTWNRSRFSRFTGPLAASKSENEASRDLFPESVHPAPAKTVNCLGLEMMGPPW